MSLQVPLSTNGLHKKPSQPDIDTSSLLPSGSMPLQLDISLHFLNGKASPFIPVLSGAGGRTSQLAGRPLSMAT